MSPKYKKFTPEMLEDTSLYRTLHQVPKVSTIEGFHCIIFFFNVCTGICRLNNRIV